MKSYDTEAAVHVAIKCKQCGGNMECGDMVEKSAGLQIAGLMLFLVGIILLFLWPIGTLLGIAVIFSARRLGYKKTKVWRCERCGYYYERC